MNELTKINKRSLLTAMAVILMASVAVAGVITYDADGADAADSTYTYLNGEITVSSKEAASNIFIPIQNAAVASSVTVPAGVTFTGTITFGYHNTVAGVNYDVPFTVITFEGGITDVTVTYYEAYDDGHGISVPAYASVSSNSATAASVNLTVASGVIAVENITGTVTAAGETATLANVSGLSIAVAEGKGILFTASNTSISAGTVTINGNFLAGDLTITDDAVVTIAKGATVTAVGEPNFDYGFTFTVPTGTQSVVFDDKTLNPDTAGGLKYTVDSLDNNSVHQLTVTYKNINTVTGGTAIQEKTVYDAVVSDGKYCLFPTAAVSDASAGKMAVTEDTAGAAESYAFSINTGDTKFAASLTTVQVYNDSNFAALLSENGDASTAKFSDCVSCRNGVVTITVPASAAFQTSDTKDSTILSFTVNGNTLLYTLNATKAADDSVSYTVTQADKVVTPVVKGTAAVKTTYDEIHPDIEAEITLDGVDAALNIEGTFDASATVYKFTDYSEKSVTSYQDVSYYLAAGTINVTGKAIFQVVNTTDETPSFEFYARGTVNGTSYLASTKAIDEDDSLYTYICTDFKTAATEAAQLKESTTLTVLGDVAVTESLTVPAATAGTDTTLKLRIGYYASPVSYHHACLTVGDADSEAVLTLAADSTGAVNTPDLTYGCIDVVNGSLKVAGLEADGAPYTYDALDVSPPLPPPPPPPSAQIGQVLGYLSPVDYIGVKAAVFMTETVDSVTYGVFTDLASALIAAKASAETEDLALRTDATVLKDCELSAEDSLDLKGYSLAVGDRTLTGSVTPTLTVSGLLKNIPLQTYDDSGVIAIFTGATVLLNASDTDGGLNGYTIVGGTLNVAKDTTLAYTSIYAMFGTLNVNGKITAETKLILNDTSFEIVAGMLVTTGTTDIEEIWTTLGQLKDADSIYTFSLYVNVPGELTLAGGTAVEYSTITGGTGLVRIGNSSKNLTYTHALTLDVTGTLNLSGYFMNNGKVAVTLGPAGQIVPTGETSLMNSSVVPGENLSYDAGVMLLDLQGTIAYDKDNYLNIQNASDAAHGFVMKVTGSVALYAIASLSGAVTVSGTGVLSAVYGNIYGLNVTDTAKFTSERCTISNLIVKDSATVVPTEPTDTAGAIGLHLESGIMVRALTVGEPTAKLSGSVNSATVEVILNPNSEEGRFIVYGNADGVKVSVPDYDRPTSNIGAGSAFTLVQTAMWLVGDENYLYATQYALVYYGEATSSSSQSFPAVEVEGYLMDGWFDARAGGTTADQTAVVGQYSDIYARFTAKAYTLTLGYVPGAVYLVNNNQMPSGQSVIHYGDVLVISVIAADGYSADNATLGDGQASVTINVTGDVTVTAAGLNTVGGDNGSLGLTDILLIVLVLTTGVVMIVILIRTLRS